MSEPELGQAFFGSKWEAHDAPGFIESDLYELSELLCKLYPDDAIGEGYGCHFSNDVFEMFPYYWGDCSCGFEQREAEWSEANDHAVECYQMVRSARFIAAGLDEHGYLPGPAFAWERESVEDGVVMVTGRPSPESSQADRQAASALNDSLTALVCREMGLSYPYGSMVHCTCTHTSDYAAWRAQNDHDERCPVVRPNFEHKASGLRVHWYKYIGRSMTVNREVEWAEWRAIVSECSAGVSGGEEK